MRHAYLKEFGFSVRATAVIAAFRSNLTVVFLNFGV